MSNREKGRSLREQELERKLRGMTNLYNDEHRNRLQIEALYEELKDNFHQLALMKVKKIAELMAIKKAPK